MKRIRTGFQTSDEVNHNGLKVREEVSEEEEEEMATATNGHGRSRATLFIGSLQNLGAVDADGVALAVLGAGGGEGAAGGGTKGGSAGKES